jgi:hypothetical protein
MSFVASLYLQLLEEQEVPTKVQWRAYKVFSLEKNETALAKLAAHPSLDTKLDAELGTHKSVKVRLSWAQRPGRTVDELKAAFSKEKRITLLEVGAQLKGMPDAWYKQMLCNPSAKVAVHIVSNDEIGLEVRKIAASIHGKASTEYRSMGSTLTLVYASRPELHESLAAGARHSREILQFVAGSVISEETQKRVIEIGIQPFLVKLEPDSRGYNYGRWEKTRNVQSALAAAMHFAKQPHHSPVLRSALKQLIEGFDASGYESNVSSLKDEVLEMLAASPEALQDTMTIASTTSDIELLMQMAKQAVSDRDSEMASAIASNKNITPEVMDRLLDAHFVYDWHRHLLPIHKSNNALVAVILSHSYYCSDELLELAEHPADALEAYLQHVSANGSKVPDWVMRSKYMKLEMLTRTPFHVVAQGELSDNLRSQLLGMLTAKLGEAPDEAWALFESVANSSGASLGDVIEATSTLANLG